MTSKKHYHVLFGTAGYLPDDNTVCRTKRKALAIARNLARRERDLAAEYNEDVRPEYPRHVSGNANDGYKIWDNSPTWLGYYIRITECWEPECLEYLDD